MAWEEERRLGGARGHPWAPWGGAYGPPSKAVQTKTNAIVAPVRPEGSGAPVFWLTHFWSIPSFLTVFLGFLHRFPSIMFTCCPVPCSPTHLIQAETEVKEGIGHGFVPITPDRLSRADIAFITLAPRMVTNEIHTHSY